MRNGSLPPAPQGLPLIGNLLDIPTKEVYRVFAQWKQLYGDICSVTVFGTSTIIINSPSIANDLFTKRGAIYSDRPSFPMASLSGWKEVIVMLTYGERFRSQRRMVYDIMGNRARVKDFAHIMEAEAQSCAQRLLEQPDDFQKPVRRAIFASILMMTHGYKVKGDGDRLAKDADEVTEQLEHLLTPGKFLVDTLPFLEYLPSWLPGGHFKQTAREWKHALVALTEEAYSFTQRQMASGTAPLSFVSKNIEGRSLSEEDHWNVQWAASSIFTGGTDSPISALTSFMLAMVLYPDVQRKAHEELDRVIGGDRLPRLADREQLPYISALVKELVRWAPGTPLGAPHRNTEDDSYMGYFIPKGTTLVANLWGFMHDPEIYPDPMEFNPDRYFEAKDRPTQPDPYEFAFGYGRRACPGTHLADAIIFVFISTILSVYNVETYVNKATGIAETPKAEFRGAILTAPKPFKATVIPRSPQAKALLGYLGE
ncbi:cytochrome P450 [Amylostereum chailletii]|nr:cytochrome P450 [Amylostereum chailletii]